MYLAYYDETGDEGLPGSSPLFALTAFYLHDSHWKDVFTEVKTFRSEIKQRYGLPISAEIHTKRFLLNKKEYRSFNISDDERVMIIDLFCELVAQLPVKIVNTVINKTIIRNTATYDVLDNALTYSIQRIENDLNGLGASERFMIITDEGRLGKMQYIARKRQRINYIPSQYGPQSYRREIKLLIEDPLPKNSLQSYFIQVSDMVSYIVYLYCLAELNAGRRTGRLPQQVDSAKITNWMHKLRNSLNLNAAPSHPYGVVCYPQQ